MAAHSPPARSAEHGAAEVLYQQLLDNGLRVGKIGDREPIVDQLAEGLRVAVALVVTEERAACLALVEDELAQLPRHEVYVPVEGAMVRLADRIRARGEG